MRTATLALLLATSAAAAFPGPGITGLGHLGPTDRTSALAISADGNFVAGYSTSGSGLTFTPVRWSISGSPATQQLPFPAGWTSALPTALSADGATVSGWRQLGGDFPGFRWSQGTGSTSLLSPSTWSQVRTRDISANGSAVVGWAVVQGLGSRVVRWDGAAQGVALPIDAEYTQAIGGAFDNANRIVGSARQTSGRQDLVRWTGSSMEVLDTIPAPTAATAAPLLASGDGSVIAGATSHFIPAFRDDAWIWDAVSGFTSIPALPGMHSVVISDISADGSLLVGMNSDASGLTRAPFVWSKQHGVQPLALFLSEAGVDLTGWSLGEATGISADGTRLVGTGLGPSGRPEAFVAIIPTPSTALALGGGALLAAHRRRCRLG